MPQVRELRRHQRLLLILVLAGCERAPAAKEEEAADPAVEDSAADSAIDTAPIEDPLAFLDGVWHVLYASTEPPEPPTQGRNAWRFAVAEGDVTALWGGEPAEIVVTEEPFAVDLVGTGAQTFGTQTAATRVEIHLDDHAETGALSGAYSSRYTVTEGDGTLVDERLSTGIITLRKVADIDEGAEASGMELLGASERIDAPGMAVNVRVAGDHAFVARYQDGLRIYDVSDPGAVAAVGHLPPTDPEIWNDVKLVGTHALIAGSSSGMVSVDVSDPSSPVEVANFPGSPMNVHAIAVDGTVAWLAAVDGFAEGGGGVVAVDVADPANPVELGRWAALDIGGSFVHDLYVADGVGYFCAWGAGLVLMDVSDPTALEAIDVVRYASDMTSHSVWVTDAPGRLVAVEGGESWGAHLRVIDVDPASAEYLSVLGELSLGDEVSIHNIMMGAGTEALISWYQRGVRVVDISDPTSPALAAWANTWTPAAPGSGRSFFEGAIGVDVADGRIYVADAARDLLVYARE